MIDTSNLPTNPGCYFFSDNKGIVLYIGKAKNLRKRVSSYFSKKEHDIKTQTLISQVKSIDFLATDNEVEALILENNLIKKHNPKYNINLKDSKRYAYLELTGEEYPRLIIARDTHNTSKDGALFGPFVSGSARNEIFDFLTKTFKIRTCRRLPKKACLRYSLNLCSAPCISAITYEDYAISIKHAKDVLSGRTAKAIAACQEEMKLASKDKEYERAISLRNILDALKWLNEKQNMERDKEYDEDIINYTVKDNLVYLLLFNISKGILEKKQDFIFEYNTDFFEEFITQYYSDNKVPKELILPEQIDNSIMQFLSSRRGASVIITVPKKGEKKQLLSLVYKNIELMFFADEQKLSQLKELLNLAKLPVVIECFDISHLSGTAMVASMVQFRNAKPSKENYRRFRIKTVEGVDDFSAIAETVRRRYTRLISEQSQLPDLIIIDGGIGQLNSALSELNKLNLRLPVISIAKEFEDIYVPGSSEPLMIDKKSSSLQLIRNIRDEAHRFAINYNRLLRKKQLVDDK